MPDLLPPDSQVLNNGRPTLAVLAGAMTSEYHEGIMRGASYVADQLGYNIIIYCGGVLNSTDPLTLAREKVFDLVDMNLISGVISPFSSHMRFLDKRDAQAFVDRFSSVPVINIGSYIEGHTNILTDYETGFKELFEHFYHQHGYRKIALIRGPKHHASSEKRMRLYQQLLKQYDLPFDEELVVYANLNRGSAKVTFGSFLDKGDKEVDAVIAISDNQALGVIDAGRDRGLRVPEDFAVVGSMNTLEGAFSNPALTSIEEPLFELGRAAATELIAQIEGKPANKEIHIPTSLTVRQSCGCKSVNHLEAYQKMTTVGKESLSLDNDPIFEETKAYFKDLVEQYKGGIVRDEVADFLKMYQKAVHNKDFAPFLVELQHKLEEALKSEDIMLWLALTAKLQLSALCYLESRPEEHSLITFIAQLISLKNEIEQSAIKFQRFETEYYLNYFRAIVNNLNSSFDLTTIKKYTVDILQLSELYISLFHDLSADVVTASSMVSVRSNQFIDLDNKDFVANKLVPNGVEHYHERYTLVVFPLSFRNKPIGFMTLNLSNRKGVAFENLRAIISSALKNEILIQDLKKAEERFSDIAHSTSNWLWETDVNHNFTYCSNSSSDIIGYPPEVLIDTPIIQNSMGDSNYFYQSMLNQEDLNEMECWYQHESGNVICLLISAKPIITETGFQGYRGIFEDITEQKLQEEKIKNLAYSDILTGLPNRTRFQDKLEETLALAAKHNSKFAIMFIDLDHFKHINDTMGHAAGDQLLVKLAERLDLSIRSTDMLARLGGDEFIIILPELEDEEDIIDIAERIFNNIKDPVSINDKPIYITLSLGISIYPTDGDDAQSLLKKGDNAMYQAKSQGRNGYVFYDKVLEEKNNLRNTYEEVLRDAIANDGFVLFYQPQVSTSNGELLGFETLIRIENESMGIVPPNNFIPLAEELGLIGQVDAWVFEECCSQYAQWRGEGFNHIRLSINLSALQLRDDSVLIKYLAILKRYDVDPADIQIEITENALIENEGVALTILEGFKAYGLTIALDDFGTGYSSLNCINLYPIDTIKIDRSFVKDALYNPKNKAVIQGIVLIANSLNLKTIAEGVETQEQYEFIKQLGCDEIQGYYFHKPYPLKEAEQLFKAK